MSLLTDKVAHQSHSTFGYLVTMQPAPVSSISSEDSVFERWRVCMAKAAKLKQPKSAARKSVKILPGAEFRECSGPEG
jgi:hypothetical protein